MARYCGPHEIVQLEEALTLLAERMRLGGEADGRSARRQWLTNCCMHGQASIPQARYVL